ncbi:MAG: hypothetical protein HDT28_07925 [Clostridiales bacterium]|nr:hypothetical protein [Clostridiales bacterium]
MLHKKSGLNHSDKIFVTMAMWIAAIVIFATALTLPMLPNMVAIFQYPVEDGPLPELSSKFNNLLLIIMWVIPALIIGVCTWLRLKNRLQNNFVSIILFSIILSCSFSVVVIYGISRQFVSSSTVQMVNIHALVCICVLFVLSMTSAAMPKIYHAERFNYKRAVNEFTHRLRVNTDKFWYVGAAGYLIAAVACAFIPSFYGYIVLAAFIAAHVLLVTLNKKSTNK